MEPHERLDPAPELGAEAAPAMSVAELSRHLESARHRIVVALRSRIPARLRAIVDVEDMWQEAALAALHSRPRLRWQGDLAFLRWVMTLARRALSAAMRKHLGRDLERPAPTPLEDLAEVLRRSSTGPALRAERRDEVARILRAIRELSPAQREILTLDVVHLMTHEEMAQVLRKSRSAVMKAHLRAMQSLKGALGT